MYCATWISVENGAKYRIGDLIWVMYATGAKATIALTVLAAWGNNEENIKNIVVPIECPTYKISPGFWVMLPTKYSAAGKSCVPISWKLKKVIDHRS